MSEISSPRGSVRSPLRSPTKSLGGSLSPMRISRLQSQNSPDKFSESPSPTAKRTRRIIYRNDKHQTVDTFSYLRLKNTTDLLVILGYIGLDESKHLSFLMLLMGMKDAQELYDVFMKKAPGFMD